MDHKDKVIGKLRAQVLKAETEKNEGMHLRSPWAQQAWIDLTAWNKDIEKDNRRLEIEKKAILKDHRRLEIENTVLQARVARLEVLDKIR